MGKKREDDPGLAYLKAIGFNRIRGGHGIIDRWTRLWGKERSDQLFEQWSGLGEDREAFYEFKNSDPQISTSFAENYDGDIIRKACNYISTHKEYFGSTILEVGCEAGYMTGFLARTFPESRIISIDSSQAAIKIAKERLDNMGLHNVEFRNCSLQDVPEQFDTVFCMRVVQENIDYDNAPYEGEPVLYQIDRYKDLTGDFTNQLISHLNDSGCLCAFERIAHDALLCGWMLALSGMKHAPNLSTYEEIRCEEVENISVFQAFITDINASDPDTIVDMWYQAFDSGLTANRPLSRWDAMAYLSKHAGKLVRGIRVINKITSKQVGRFAIFESINDDSILYYLLGAGENIELSVHDAGAKPSLDDELETAIRANKSAGFIIQDISPDDEITEESCRSHS